MLARTLRQDDIVLLDNLSSYKAAGVAEAITAQGAQLIYLPPYSPDLNPIEQAFANSKRRCAARPSAAATSSGTRLAVSSNRKSAGTFSKTRDRTRRRSKGDSNRWSPGRKRMACFDHSDRPESPHLSENQTTFRGPSPRSPDHNRGRRARQWIRRPGRLRRLHNNYLARSPQGQALEPGYR
jgi:transposase